MNPELRSFLEAMEQRPTQHTDKQMADAREETAAALTALAANFDEVRTEARALHEDTWKKIDALGEGLSTHQRQETHRILAVREQALLDGHILP